MKSFRTKTGGWFGIGKDKKGEWTEGGRKIGKERCEGIHANIFFEIIIEVINEIGRDKIKSITERFKSDANVICR